MLRHAFRCISVTDPEKEGSCKLSFCIINIAKMQSDCENTGVFKDFHFVTCVAFVYNPVTRRLQKRLQNHSLEGPKTVPKCSSMTYASWKRFWDGFGTSLDSHMAPQKRSLRRPRGIKKRLLFSLASQDVSRMDSGRHLDPLGLDFESFWEALLA